MVKYALSIIVVCILGLGIYLYLAKPCLAGICIGKCINSSVCGTGCFCGKEFPKPMGKCYSADRVDELLGKGYEILP